MKHFELNRLILSLLLFCLVLASCQRENMDSLISETPDPNLDLEMIDLTGQVNFLAENGEVNAQYAYLTSCEEDDFYVHSLIYADDFIFENGLVQPIGNLNQIFWVSFDTLSRGTFQAYGSEVGPDENIFYKHLIVEIDFTEPGNSTGGRNQRSYIGNFYANPTYNPDSQDISTLNGEFEVSRVACSYDNVVPSILTQSSSENITWAEGRAQITKDEILSQHSTIMQYCEKMESGASILAGYIHIGQGITDYSSGSKVLAIAGDYLIYFSPETLPKSGDQVEASLVKVNADLILNFNAGFIQDNGYAIVLNFDFVDDNNAEGSFEYFDPNGAEFSNISGTFNTKITDCN